eukprot:1192766-Rhodomonas_salina.2
MRKAQVASYPSLPPSLPPSVLCGTDIEDMLLPGSLDPYATCRTHMNYHAMCRTDRHYHATRQPPCAVLIYPVATR